MQKMRMKMDTLGVTLVVMCVTDLGGEKKTLCVCVCVVSFLMPRACVCVRFYACLCMCVHV